MASVAIIINEKAPGPSISLYITVLLRNSGVLQSLLYLFQFVMLSGYPTVIDWAAT